MSFTFSFKSIFRAGYLDWFLYWTPFSWLS